MKLKIKKNDDNAVVWFDEDEIEILKFNYDGAGRAIIKTELGISIMNLDALNFVLACEHYELIE